jgi:hypothetical protein
MSSSQNLKLASYALYFEELLKLMIFENNSKNSQGLRVKWLLG